MSRFGQQTIDECFQCPLKQTNDSPLSFQPNREALFRPRKIKTHTSPDANRRRSFIGFLGIDDSEMAEYWRPLTVLRPKISEFIQLNISGDFGTCMRNVSSIVLRG